MDKTTAPRPTTPARRYEARCRDVRATAARAHSALGRRDFHVGTPNRPAGEARRCTFLCPVCRQTGTVMEMRDGALRVFGPLTREGTTCERPAISATVTGRASPR